VVSMCSLRMCSLTAIECVLFDKLVHECSWFHVIGTGAAGARGNGGGGEGGGGGGGGGRGRFIQS